MEKLCAEGASLKEENRQLKEEMKKEQVIATAHFDRLLGLIVKSLLPAKNLVLRPRGCPCLIPRLNA